MCPWMLSKSIKEQKTVLKGITIPFRQSCISLWAFLSSTLHKVQQLMLHIARLTSMRNALTSYRGFLKRNSFRTERIVGLVVRAHVYRAGRPVLEARSWVVLHPLFLIAQEMGKMERRKELATPLTRS